MRFFQISGILETISTISLFFIAMPLKYLGGNEILVKIIGKNSRSTFSPLHFPCLD